MPSGIRGFSSTGGLSGSLTCFMETAIGLSAVYGSLPVKCLVEDHSEGVEIALRGCGLAKGLFRGHVAGGTHHGSRPGDGHGGAGPGDAEVCHLRRAPGGEYYVLGLYVAMDHSPLGAAHERGMVHRDVGGPFFRLAPVVDLDYVRVGEGRRAHGLALETLGELLVAGVLFP